MIVESKFSKGVECFESCSYASTRSWNTTLECFVTQLTGAVNHFSRATYGGKQKRLILEGLKSTFWFSFSAKIKFRTHSCQKSTKNKIKQCIKIFIYRHLNSKSPCPLFLANATSHGPCSFEERKGRRPFPTPLPPTQSLAQFDARHVIRLSLVPGYSHV